MNVNHEIDNDLSAYLVFLILGNIKKLRDINPDHILVKAVTDVLGKVPEIPHPDYCPCVNCVQEDREIKDSEAIQLELDL